jgi:uncharacterized membrane protein HdeD (DUF308 family)
MERTETHGRQGFGGSSRGMPAISDIFNVAERAERVGRYWWLLLLSGIAWIVVAAIVFRFDYTSVVAVATLFGILAIAIGGAELALAMMSQHWWRLLHALLGVVFIATGVIAFFTPGDTFVGLAAVISFYFIFAGVWDIVSSLAMRELPGWWIQLISGLLELGLGYWAAGSWRVSATVLVAFVGAIVFIRGVTQISLAFSIHSVREALPQR